MSAPRHPGRRHTSKCSSICIREPKWALSKIAYFNKSKILFFFLKLWRFNSVCQEYKWHQVNILQMASVCCLYASACFTNSFLWIWSKWKIVLFKMFHWFFLSLFHPTFATAVIWPDYGLGKQISVPVCYGIETTMGTDHLLPLWHHFTSICWKQQGQCGPFLWEVLK